MSSYDSDIVDMVEAIHKNYDDKTSALNLLKVLAEKFNNQEVEEAAKDYAIEHELCYDCEVELEFELWEENRPYGDTVAYEECSVRVCSECEKEFSDS